MPYVESSAIRRIEWSGDVLSVWFRSGDRYDYDGVPERVYRGFLAAGSHGAFFSHYVRDRYPILRKLQH
ncbi:KTSC domain-containing protein [Paracoccus sp. Z118]|uniref:KTSC domain-containing protein n=1 Tax=Paracoccus sp. Z118 TaxID=2851017 RepID=UPI001C2BC413|nr:KTSC domain-containing protein [Paracoccus sp. Z118]MBV0892143.1 KTSC domain-containing protein [Paracoccus sp. Z118]